MFSYLPIDKSLAERIPIHKEAWLFITPPKRKYPTHCRECKKELAGESTVVHLTSGSYCERCYCYWYAYRNKRWTFEQAFYRSIGYWPHRVEAGMLAFTKPKKGNKRYGKLWSSHPSDFDKVLKHYLNPDQILIDGENFPPELVKAKEQNST